MPQVGFHAFGVNVLQKKGMILAENGPQMIQHLVLDLLKKILKFQSYLSQDAHLELIIHHCSQQFHYLELLLKTFICSCVLQQTF